MTALVSFWRKLMLDNATWYSLFMRRRGQGWAVDLRRVNPTTLSSAALFAYSHVYVQPRSHIPFAPLEVDWHELYKTRAELDRRWSPNPTVFTNFNSEDKENISLWGPKVQRLSGHMDRYISFLSIFSFPFFASLVVRCRRGGCQCLLLPLLPLLAVSVVLLPKEPLPTTDPPLILQRLLPRVRLVQNHHRFTRPHNQSVELEDRPVPSHLCRSQW